MGENRLPTGAAGLLDSSLLISARLPLNAWLV